MKKLIQIIFVMLTAAAASGAHAACELWKDATSIGFIIPTIPPIDLAAVADAPNGTVIGSVVAAYGTGKITIKPDANCSGKHVTLDYHPYYKSSFNTVYLIPGIGARFNWANAPLGIPAGYLPQTSPPLSTAGGAIWFGEGTMTMELVKTGPIRPGTHYVNVQVGEVRLEGVPSEGFNIFPQAGGSMSIVIKNKPTCSVSTKDVQVPLGSVQKREFTGVGSVSQEKSFNISLDCVGGDAGETRKIHATLTDHTNPGNESDVLSLAMGSGAGGIGIQVLNGNTVIKYGPDSAALGNTNQWAAGTTGVGTFNIPLRARYVQTAPTVTSGPANALATFTMSYE